MTTIHNLSKSDAVERIRATGATLAATLAALDVDTSELVARTADAAELVGSLSDDDFGAFLRYVERIYQEIGTDAK